VHALLKTNYGQCIELEFKNVLELNAT